MPKTHLTPDQLHAKRIQVADNLRYLRELMNISQADVCKALKIPKSNVNNWETARSMPSSSRIKALADFFQTTPDILRDKPMRGSAGETRLTIKDERLDQLEKELILRDKLIASLEWRIKAQENTIAELQQLCKQSVLLKTA